MFLVGRTHMITDRSLEDTIRYLKEVGYQGIELSILRGPTKILAWDYMDDYVIDHINKLCAELEMPITALSCHQNYVDDDVTFEAQKKLLRTAKKYGTDVVIMSTFMPFEQREGHPEVYDVLVERSRVLCDIAEEEGVSIAIEVEPNQLMHNLKGFFEIAEKVNSPAFKLNFDVGHLYLSEVDLFKAIQDSKEFIAYSHIENMCMGEHCHKLPWEGEIDLLAVYKYLAENAYDGPVALDLYLQNYVKVSPQCVEYINKEVFSKI